MNTVTIKLFRLHELAPKAKAKALESLCAFLSETMEPETVTEAIKETAAYEFGLKAEDCYWRLSCCQGDGVAFYGAICLDTLAEKNAEVRELVAELTALDRTVSVRSEGANSRYHHYNSMRAEVEADKDTPEVAALCEDLRRAVQLVLRDASHRCEEVGYAEIEYQTGEEYATDYAEANDLWFTEDGRKWEGEEPE